MRVSPPNHGCIPTNVPPVPAIPLTPEVSKALIASGIFAHNPNEVLWKAAAIPPIALGGPAGSAISATLPGGVHLQAHAAKPEDGLLAAFFEVGKQAQPIVELIVAHGPPDAVAEGFALLKATPKMLHAWTSPGRGKAENLILFGSNTVRVLKIGNSFANVPHVGLPLEVIACIFQVGEEVYLAAEQKA